MLDTIKIEIRSILKCKADEKKMHYKFILDTEGFIHLAIKKYTDDDFIWYGYLSADHNVPIASFKEKAFRLPNIYDEEVEGWMVMVLRAWLNENLGNVKTKVFYE